MTTSPCVAVCWRICSYSSFCFPATCRAWMLMMQTDLGAAFAEAEKLREAAKYTEAGAAVPKGGQLSLRLYGEEHADTATILNSLGILHVAQGKYTPAEVTFKRSLTIRETIFPKNHPHVAHTLDHLADLPPDPGKYAPGEPLCRRSLQIREETYGPHHAEVAQSCITWRFFAMREGRLTEAEQLFYERSLAIRESVNGKDHTTVADGVAERPGQSVRGPSEICSG